MELLCPHCLKKVTVSDDKAGQVLNCPLCQGVFAAPSLAPIPTRMSAPPPMTAPPPVNAAPPPPPSVIPMMPVSPAPAPMPSVPMPPPQVEPPRPPPKPAPPPADYTRRYGFCLRPDVLVCIPPPCLFLIFVFSFFPWHVDVAVLNNPSILLWGLAFTDRGSGLFLAYTVFTIFLTPLVSIACVVFELRLAPTPPPLAPLMPWKSGITFLLLFITFVLFTYDYQQSMFATAVGSPIVLGEKVAFRLHFIALVASGLELWVQSRQARNLPLPRFSMKL